VLHSVVFDGHLPLPPSHVDADTHVAEVVNELDLRFRRWQPGTDKEHSHTTLLR